MGAGETLLTDGWEPIGERPTARSSIKALPVGVRSKAPGRRTRRPSASARPIASGPLVAARVLLVETDRVFARALARRLRGRDLLVDLASSGAEALELTTAAHHDLALVELHLPDLEGPDLCAALRTRGCGVV